MSLSVSYNQINSGIDSAALREVTQQIFQRANTQNTVLAKADLTKFNRVTLGSDFYSGKVDASTANQIAMTKIDMQVKLSENAVNSIKYLSSEASKSILKNVDGKISIATTEEIKDKQSINEKPVFGQLTETTDLDSDKKGSNPFYKGEFLNIKKEEEMDETINIFA